MVVTTQGWVGTKSHPSIARKGESHACIMQSCQQTVALSDLKVDSVTLRLKEVYALFLRALTTQMQGGAQ